MRVTAADDVSSLPFFTKQWWKEMVVNICQRPVVVSISVHSLSFMSTFVQVYVYVGTLTCRLSCVEYLVFFHPCSLCICASAHLIGCGRMGTSLHSLGCLGI